MEGVTARDLMSREFVGVSEGDDVGEVRELMVDEQVDGVLVLRGPDPVGIVSCHDVLRTGARDAGADQPVESVMRPPPQPVSTESDVSSVLARLAGVDAGQLPVTDGQGQLVGVVSESDVIAAAASMITEPRAAESPGGPEPSTAERLGGAGPAGIAESATSATQEGTEAYSSQGVCESCGSLSGDLQVRNGQSQCPECRDV